MKDYLTAESTQSGAERRNGVRWTGRLLSNCRDDVMDHWSFRDSSEHPPAHFEVITFRAGCHDGNPI
jgi:hypothetical protein